MRFRPVVLDVVDANVGNLSQPDFVQIQYASFRFVVIDGEHRPDLFQRVRYPRGQRHVAFDSKMIV